MSKKVEENSEKKFFKYRERVLTHNIYTGEEIEPLYFKEYYDIESITKEPKKIDEEKPIDYVIAKRRKKISKKDQKAVLEAFNKKEEEPKKDVIIEKEIDTPPVIKAVQMDEQPPIMIPKPINYVDQSPNLEFYTQSPNKESSSNLKIIPIPRTVYLPSYTKKPEQIKTIYNPYNQEKKEEKIEKVIQTVPVYVEPVKVKIAPPKPLEIPLCFVPYHMSYEEVYGNKSEPRINKNLFSENVVTLQADSTQKQNINIDELRKNKFQVGNVRFILQEIIDVFEKNNFTKSTNSGKLIYTYKLAKDINNSLSSYENTKNVMDTYVADINVLNRYFNLYTLKKNIEKNLNKEDINKNFKDKVIELNNLIYKRKNEELTISQKYSLNSKIDLYSVMLNNKSKEIKENPKKSHSR